MRPLLSLLGMVLLVSCSTSGADGETGETANEDGADKESIEASLFCCTLREYCLACGCNDAETKVVESKVEAACKQLLDSSEYECALGDEMTALALCASGASTPAPNEDLSRCVEWGDDGCVCRENRYEDDVPFEGTCEESSVGERGLCCRGDEYCHCEPVLCGLSAISGTCICGVGVAFDVLVTSCDDTGQTCCTQNTGYCYCEDGCEQRFGNYVVSSCNQNTPTATCYDDQTRVTSCEGPAADGELPAAPVPTGPVFTPAPAPSPPVIVIVPVPDPPALPSSPTTQPTATEPATTDPVSKPVTTEPTTDSSETPPTDAENLERLRGLKSASCKYQQRCTPDAVETDLEACVDRSMNQYDIGYLRVPEVSEDAAACFNALADLPCAEHDSRDTDITDQFQWYNLNDNACWDLVGYSCMSASECGTNGRCSGAAGQCGECQRNGSQDTCSVDSDCQFGDECVSGQCLTRVEVGQPCTSPTQCVSGWCNSGTCEATLPLGAECTVPDACGLYAWCSAGRCTRQGQVGEPCDEDQWVLACHWGLNCVAGQCQLWGHQTGLEGEGCVFNAQCAPGLSCYGYVCAPSPDEYCHSDNECPDDEHCAPSCDVARDCAETCDRTIAELESCLLDCQSNQACIELCNDEAACLEQCNATPADCVETECQPREPLGGDCTLRTDCQSDACSDDGRCIERVDCD